MKTLSPSLNGEKDYLLPNRPALELYQLYDDAGDRVDIEEANNLAASLSTGSPRMSQTIHRFTSIASRYEPLGWTS